MKGKFISKETEEYFPQLNLQNFKLQVKMCSFLIRLQEHSIISIYL